MAAAPQNVAVTPNEVVLVVEIPKDDADSAISPLEQSAPLESIEQPIVTDEIKQQSSDPTTGDPPAEWPRRKIWRWKAPLSMMTFFIIGFALSLAHCIYYPKLSGMIVGNPDSQEAKIRYGFPPKSSSVQTFDNSGSERPFPL